MVATDRLLAYEGQNDSVDKGIQPDGRRLWRFSQSKLKAVDVCPERGRRTLLGLMEDGATDSTALGRAVHAAIEQCLRDVIEGQGPWALTDMVEMACADFDEEMALPSSRWVKHKNAGTLHDQIGRCLATWYERVLPGLRPLAVEVNFGPLVVYEDELRIIEARGQIDYIDEVDGLGDWKTSGRSWEPWEHQRWDIQPSLYLPSFELCVADSLGLEPHGDPWPWTWHVLNVNGQYQRIETTRTREDWDWLIDRMVTIAKMLEADLPEWHKNDASALCSPSWCGAYAACKGRFIEDPKTQRQSVTGSGVQEDNR